MPISSDYTICPKCKRRTVLFKFGRNGDDYYECTYRRFPVVNGQTTCESCSWSTFVEPEHWDRTGKADLAAWEEINKKTHRCPTCRITLTAGDRTIGKCADGHPLPVEAFK